MTKQQERKQHIRAFMQAHYTDERLAQLLAHCQDGKFAFNSCCCFVAIPTADHALQGEGDWHHQHYADAHRLSGASEAESAVFHLVDHLGIHLNRDFRRILIPIIRAEIKRRDALVAPTEVLAETQRVAEPTNA